MDGWIDQQHAAAAETQQKGARKSMKRATFLAIIYPLEQ
jgi:hypothetical protein